MREKYHRWQPLLFLVISIAVTIGISMALQAKSVLPTSISPAISPSLKKSAEEITAPTTSSKKGTEKEAEKEKSKETPKDTSKEISKETPKETQKEISKENPKEISKETQKETPKETLKEVVKDTPKDSSPQLKTPEDIIKTPSILEKLEKQPEQKEKEQGKEQEKEKTKGQVKEKEEVKEKGQVKEKEQEITKEKEKGKEKEEEKEQGKEKEQEKSKDIFSIVPLNIKPSDSTPEFVITTPKKDDKQKILIEPIHETPFIEKIIIEKKSDDALVTIPLTSTNTSYRDISESHPSYQILKDFIELALKLGNLKIPPNQLFKPKNKTRWLFALQMALTVRGESCASGKGNLKTKCMAKAVDLGFIENKGFADRTITKGDFYELMLLAGKFPSVEPTQKLLCTDVDMKHPYANIIATANYYGLVKRYTSKGKTGFCFPDAPLTKIDAVVTASKALETR